MKKLDTTYDNIIETNYDLFSVKLSELKTLAKSWYLDTDLKKFDNRWVRDDNRDEKNFIEMKKSGLICNLFFAYIEDGKYYLLDGFNRLFTDYGAIEQDTTIYLKVITDKLPDHKLMGIMYRLNMWKLSSDNNINGGFKVNDFFDRGFRLLLNTKFNIQLYDYKNSEYDKRTRDNDDLKIIDKYFVYEYEEASYFKTSFQGVNILLSQENIINDIKALIKGNDYLKSPFGNYSMFLEGFAMYLAYLRYKRNTKQYEFDFFLNKLYENKAFFKKLQGMSGNESTRKNIYKFYRDLNLHL